jgi:hypothetical protein
MGNIFTDSGKEVCETGSAVMGWLSRQLVNGRLIGHPNKEYKVKEEFKSNDLNATVALLENLRRGENPPVWIENGGQSNRAENASTKQIQALNRTVAAMIGDEAFDIRKASRLAELQRFVGLKDIETTRISLGRIPDTAKDQLVLGPETAYNLLEKLKRAGMVQLVNKCE